ncbi:hypothetical protein P7C71_g3812, partial [Lecanoromycetidae sp. Uapishka_2]
MGDSLSEYLRMRDHPDLQGRDWSRIIVKGKHERDHERACIASIEKRDKPFNWMRPTTTTLDPTTIQLNVFLGVDYVEHYAAITATALCLKGKDFSVVEYILPSKTERFEPFLNSNLAQMGIVDIAIIGYVHKMDRWTQGSWAESTNELFSWKKMLTKQGYHVAFLGCRICYWGDIGGNLVRMLQKLNGVKCVVYVGKLGSLQAEYIPNHTLASGGQSLLLGEMLDWENPLEPYLHNAPSVARGVHCSLCSVLDESKDWLREMEKRCDFVDPEIGHMAKASLEGGTEFGYLHIISDNLARKFDEDLSNERRTDVIEGRRQLMIEIQDVLGSFFDEWTPKQGIKSLKCCVPWMTGCKLLKTMQRR